MTENVSFEEREARLLNLTRNTKRLNQEALVQTLSIAPEQKSRLQAALNIYLWACLSASYPGRSFDLSGDMLRDYEKDMLGMPNVTPNGLILPKRENLLAFNLLQGETAAAFGALGMAGEIARVQYPVNVRLQSGKPDAAKDGRARASAKPHSDIWAGDPASGIIVFLSMLGDPKHSGIRFFKPEPFPKSLVRKLEDFDEGASLMKGAKEIASFDDSGWFLVDPYVIHQTTKLGSGSRISLDFRFVPKQRVASDSDEDAARAPFFIDYEAWARLGDRTLIATQEGLREFLPDANKDVYTTGYPVKLTLIDIESTYAAKLKKIAN